LVVFP
jgi:hypothetical protein